MDDVPFVDPYSIKTSNIYITDSQQKLKQILREIEYEDKMQHL